MSKRIAVIGATGLLGKPVTVQLLRAGFQVKALVRDPHKAKEMLPDGVERVSGDLRNTADIQNLIKNAEAVYLNLSIKPDEKPGDWHTETDGLQEIIKACKNAGVQRVAMISSLVHNYQGMNNFSWWAFDVKRQSIALMKASGIPCTIFYPSTFMENFPANYMQGKFLFLAGKSEQKQYFIAAEDFGKQVARSFQLNEPGNKEYAVQGTEALTTDEAAEIFRKYYRHKKLSILNPPIGILKFMGNFVQTINYGAHIIDAMNKYPEKFEAENTWQELGKPAITVKMYAESL